MSKIMEMIVSTKNALQDKVRHSFAQRAEDKEINPEVLQKMYRHKSIFDNNEISVELLFDKTDAAIDAVIDF